MSKYYIKICDEKDADKIEYMRLPNRLIDDLLPVIINKREEAAIFDSKDEANLYKDNVNTLLTILNSTRRASVVALETDDVSERLIVTVPKRWDGTTPVEIQNLQLGDSIFIIGILWRVAHYVDDGNKIHLTLCSEHVLGNAPYFTEQWMNGRMKLNYKYCHKLCDDLEYQLNQHLTYMVSLDIDDETDRKCHLLTLKQLNGEYDWFKSETDRITFDLNNKLTPYWTGTRSTSSSYVWSVNTDGSFNGYSYAGLTNGFRPCIHLSFNMYCQ